jgi:nicotinamide-nucleotide amidase
VAPRGSGPASAPTAEIVTVGSEVLSGDVLDTNSHWLCMQLTDMGVRVSRVTQVPDALADIVETIAAARARGSRLVLTIGGLGPTADDRTLEAVARATGRPLQPHLQALAWVSDRYRELAAAGYVDSVEMTDSRRKMATFPQDAQPVYNRVGVAPAVVIREGSHMLAALPGVPDELKTIFAEGLEALIVGALGQGASARLRAEVGTGDESLLAPLLGRVSAAYPDVYIKSRARRFGSERRFAVTLAASGSDTDAARECLNEAWTALERALSESGIEVRRVTR